MHYKGDFLKGQIVRFDFTTFGLNGAPTIFRNEPSALVLNDTDSFEESIIVNYQDRNGLNKIIIDTNEDFYKSGHDYTIIVKQGIVASVDVTNTVIGSFSIENRSSSRATPEVQGVPAAISTPQSRLAWLFKLSRNATQVTKDYVKIQKDDNSNDIQANHNEVNGIYNREKFK